MPERRAPQEIALSAAWHAGSFGADLQTTDGASVHIVHRGTWSHGLGPDFRDALVLFNGRELRAGSVEIHLQSRGWTDHGHHLDSAYDDVILHAVAHHHGQATRRSDGAIVPVVALGPLASLELPDMAQWEWHRVGGEICAPHIAATSPDTLRQILYRLGDVRLAARSARIEARLPTEPSGEILWQEILDGLGFSANREPMRELARIVSVEALESLLQSTSSGERLDVARGILLGVAGFLPLSPSESHLGRLSPDAVSQLESCWRDRGAPWQGAVIASSRWNRARVRPANHPVPRLLAAANLIANAGQRGGLLAAICGSVIDGDPIPTFRALTASDHFAGIGADRALDIVASGIVPVALAVAAHSGNTTLADAAARQWEQLPAPSANAVTRRAATQVAGSTLLGRIGARGSQGLIHLDTVLCQPRRCFECPIASAELSVKG
jgi:hypothetical protein